MWGKLLGSNKKAITILAPMIAIVFYLFLYLYLRELDVTRDHIEELLAPLGLWGLVVAFLAQLTISMTPIPDTTSMLPILFLFGPILGVIPIIAGIQTAAMVHYAIARKLGAKFIYKRFPRARVLADKFEKNMKLETLLLIRMFAFVSFDITAYLAGISGVPFKKFVVASTLAMLPIVIPNALLTIGLFVEEPFWFVVVWAVTVAFVLAFAILAKRSRKLIAR